MIRITKIIGRDKIFDYLGNPNVCKVELSNAENKGMKNPKACKVYIYLDTQNLSSQNDDVYSILGQCLKYSIEPLEKGSNSFLKGILAQRELGWLSATHIKKLVVIEEKNKICFGIPKYFFEFIEEFS